MRFCGEAESLVVASLVKKQDAVASSQTQKFYFSSHNAYIDVYVATVPHSAFHDLIVKRINLQPSLRV